MLPDYFEFTLPTKLIYGIGILDSIEDAVAKFKNRKVLLVTDKILIKAGPVGKVKKGFKKAGINITTTFDKVPPNSTIKTVQDCAALGQKKKCDMIIAVGGGSVIDTAKVANLLMTKKGKVQDHMGAYLLDASETLLPFIVIPTTAGTGSEVTKVAVIADPDNDVKLPFAEEQFLPDLAILDPEMTVTMPGRLTAYTILDNSLDFERLNFRIHRWLQIICFRSSSIYRIYYKHPHVLNYSLFCLDMHGLHVQLLQSFYRTLCWCSYFRPQLTGTGALLLL